MLLLSLLHSADEAERIIFILQLFHETSCIKRHDVISCTQRLQIHRFVNYLFGFSIIIQKNCMIQVASHVLALRNRGHANDVRSMVKILFSAKS